MVFGMGAFGESPFGEATPGLLYRVEASHTKEGKERLRAYYEALGRFVDMFSRVETAVALTLWHYAKTAPEIAKIIFSGTKVDLSSTYIKQLAAATKASQERQNDLTNVFQQLGIINGARNLILHYGATSVAEGNAIVTNALRAKGEPDTFPISPTALDQMTADLNKIIAHLNCLHLGNSAGYTILGNPMLDAWRYKHPEAKKKRSKKAEGRPPRKRG